MPALRTPSTTLLAVVLCIAAAAAAKTSFARIPFQEVVPHTPQALISAMLEQENAVHRDRYEYVIQERSDRTAHHLWTERVVELPNGRIHLLLAEDGKSLSPERAQQQRAELAIIAADSAEFARTGASESKDEAHSRQMLDLLPRAFVFENVRLDGALWHLDFRPNDKYSPVGLEERVLHGMSGSLTIDAKDLRLTHIEARLPRDISIGFGILATIKAGSNFGSDRQKIDGHWRTVHVITDIRGKAGLFKSVAKNADITRSDFHYLPGDVTVAQAVALVEQPQP